MSFRFTVEGEIRFNTDHYQFMTIDDVGVPSMLGDAMMGKANSDDGHNGSPVGRYRLTVERIDADRNGPSEGPDLGSEDDVAPRIYHLTDEQTDTLDALVDSARPTIDLLEFLGSKRERGEAQGGSSEDVPSEGPGAGVAAVGIFVPPAGLLPVGVSVQMSGVTAEFVRADTAERLRARLEMVERERDKAIAAEELLRKRVDKLSKEAQSEAEKLRARIAELEGDLVHESEGHQLSVDAWNRDVLPLRANLAHARAGVESLRGRLDVALRRITEVEVERNEARSRLALADRLIERMGAVRFAAMVDRNDEFLRWAVSDGDRRAWVAALREWRAGGEK